MSKKLLKLALLLSILAASSALGLPKPAQATTVWCPDICCDTGCTLVRHCGGLPGHCSCSPYCIGE